MLRLVTYTGNHSREWNQFVAQSRTPHFLFDRNYMEYHSDRFTDCSYLAYDDLKLVALFPASRSDDIVASHGGLTFGGFLTDKSVRTVTMLGLFDELLNQLIQDGVKSLVYKPIPHFYQSYPSDEDLYALFRTDATLVRRDVSTTILVSHRFTASKGRKSTLKKAVSMGFVVQESKNFANFMELEATHLESKFGLSPTHTPGEMELLASRFPQNIRLFEATLKGDLLGGTLIYETPQVAHAQYIAATEDGWKLGALDVVIDHLLSHVYRDKTWFDFGISTEQKGRFLNEGLIQNKESYGGRATVYDQYEIQLTKTHSSKKHIPQTLK